MPSPDLKNIVHVEISHRASELGGLKDLVPAKEGAKGTWNSKIITSFMNGTSYVILLELQHEGR